MIWEKDRLKPIQPYIVLDTEHFYQEVYLRQGISHFYTYQVKNGANLRMVPDGCIELYFEYTDDGMCGFARGTPISYKEECMKNTQEVFGVRFMPGVQPEIISATMRDLFDQSVPLEDIMKGDMGWLKDLEQETDFYQRIRVFLENYTKVEKRRVKPYGKKELAMMVKQLIYKSDGLIKVAELEEHTDYSVRYINKVFIEEMGFSPKVFCKIIQFQRAIEFLNYGAPDKMTDAAVALGYYDQSQFIRDFTKYAGITPKKYLKLLQEKNYKSKVNDTYFFK